ncbi:hypothetical protein [Cohnella zeiphila]|uniref:SHOCT domain-containing protein n=1 Tax=Cohnella zeiphila TaxID=2761120 RepID=A0A7X0SKR1_9BACL|nr:hypothetical protein [Cohnella zeiphila]MBB6731787.1 hypothetical protein [Cohnella zeiphila]
MNPKRMLAICTLALMLTINSGFWSRETSAGDLLQNDESYGAYSPDKTEIAAEPTEAGESESQDDPFLSLLGAESDEQVRDALYNGQSLADIASASGADPGDVIDLQIRQLTEQLKQRMLEGSISLQQYQAQKAEIAELVTRSAYSASLT